MRRTKQNQTDIPAHTHSGGRGEYEVEAMEIKQGDNIIIIQTSVLRRHQLCDIIKTREKLRFLFSKNRISSQKGRI
jgi:hypothetical protein